MDTFMDKLAQRLNAQEMIDANSAADVEELNKLRGRIKEYDECLEQMREINQELCAVNEQMSRLVGDTITPELQRLVESSIAKIEGAQVNVSGIDDLVQESREQLQTIRDMGSIQLQRAADESGSQLQKLAEESNAQIRKLVQENTLQFQKYADESDAQMQRAAEESGARLQHMAEESTAQMKKVAVEANAQMQQNMAENASKLQKVMEDSSMKVQRVSEESLRKLREFQQQGQDTEELKQIMQEKLENTNDCVHRECVKVYRNVQAVVLEESGKQAESLSESSRSTKSILTKIMGLSAAAFVFSLISAAIQILSMLHII
ncbi:MAG: hypothetical protein NC251_11385 [Lachnoclostridium sp.]|nr:hypothetical protein [Lachnospira sp.]MCM1249022.1 hypothetical protein [Lachnoclostridium sp.]MCM1535890.1 hypothetical protein [Clostridium sp.]